MNYKLLIRCSSYLFLVGISLIMYPAQASMNEIGTLSGLSVAGEETIFVIGANENHTFCGFVIDFGDGEMRDVKIDTDIEVFPRKVPKTYAKAGKYRVSVKGKRVTTHWPCSGEVITTITVEEKGVGVSVPTSISSSGDEALWKTAEKSDNTEEYNAYLKQYPNGKYTSLAREKLQKLQGRVEQTSRQEESKPGMAVAASMQTQPVTQPAMIAIPGKNYEMGKYEVTQKEWRDVMGSNPSKFTSCGDTCPVEQVSWNDVQEFLQKLNSKTGKQYRLPTEAEWEYACYGGSQSEYCGGGNIDSVAWYKDNSNGTAHPAGQKQANGYGLYDMSGNVGEWMQDELNGGRVVCGGSWYSYPSYSRSASSVIGSPAFGEDGIGFRLARTLTPEQNGGEVQGKKPAIASTDAKKPSATSKKATDIDAQLELAEKYYKGVGVAKDYAKVLEIVEPLAAQGNAKAQNRLATLYSNGLGVPKDKVKALELFQKAVDQGDVKAQFNLGEWYMYGNGVPKNQAKAAELYQKAAAQGQADAQAVLGYMHLYGVGIPKDQAKGAELIQEAAKHGNALGQYQLSVMYYNGYVVPKDETESVEWLQKAAYQGHADSQRELARYYMNGIGIPKDQAKAVEWIQKAAVQGDDKAQNMLAWVYQNGLDHFSKDNAKAVEWYQKAAAQGNVEAKNALKLMGY